ncbi:MAG TPA: pectate lyase [Acidobacteriaceae bacterium]
MRASGFLLFLVLPLHAAVIGTSKPAEPLTEERIRAIVPASQRGPWLAYLHRSEEQMKADRAVLAKEREGMTEIPPLPPQGFSGRAIPLHRDAAFYKSDDARKIGDVILSFQTPAGGWSKNLAMTAPRLKGQSYATANLAPVDSPSGDFDKPQDEKWHYIGTLDNDATNTELHFLAELSAALPEHEGDSYRSGFLRGIEYLLHAQYPNGGWPQVWPLEGGYHDAITFNDDAVTESAQTLSLVAEGKRTRAEHKDGARATEAETPEEDYTFVPAALRARAKASVAKALDCILKAQVRIPAADGKATELTVWPQQADMLTLQPVAARNYEPAALSSGESASVMEYLMSLDRPSPAVVRSLHAAADWMQAHKIMGYTWSGGRGTPGGRKLTAVEGAGPLWARYYSLTTGKPIFGDRDKTIHDDVKEISLERRNGYAWYSDGPAHVLADYAAWWTTHP